LAGNLVAGFGGRPIARRSLRLAGHDARSFHEPYANACSHWPCSMNAPVRSIRATREPYRAHIRFV
jgi:hypothetical protein